MKRNAQGALYCRCGREKIRANGHCATCYTLRQQDARYFGGLRERVLERDGYSCRVCGASGRNKHSIAVHHRVPGKSLLQTMISLCLGCHAKVHRTKAVLSEMPPLLLELWREQHPHGPEQTTLDFRISNRQPFRSRCSQNPRLFRLLSIFRDRSAPKSALFLTSFKSMLTWSLAQFNI